MYFSPVGNMELFDCHCDPIVAFTGNLVSNWTLALNTWNATRDSEDIVRREDMAERSRMAQSNAARIKGKILT